MSKVSNTETEHVVLKHKTRKMIAIPKSRWEKNKIAYQSEGYHPATAEEIKATHEVEAIIPHQATTEIQEKGD